MGLKIVKKIKGRLILGDFFSFFFYMFLYRDDDDINDVASMAGVNLSEESARILATNSELVGSVTRSCKDETFLSTSSLSRRALEIGEPPPLPLRDP